MVNEDTCDLKETKQKKANPLRWGVWVFLWGLIGLAVLVYWYLSLIIAGWMIYGTYRLSKYCRNRYRTPPMLPPRFTARVRQAKWFQVFFVWAAQHPTYHLLILFAALFFALALDSVEDLIFKPVLNLEEMDVRTGVVEKVYQRKLRGKARVCGDRVYLRTQDGGAHRYHGILNEDTIAILSDAGMQQVTIWSQRAINSPPCRVVDWINQIKAGDRIIEPYIKKYRVRFKKLTPKLIMFFSALGFLCLWWIWSGYRKKTDDLNTE